MQCIGDISEEVWQDCITLFLQTEMCCDAAIITNSLPWLLASYPEVNLFQLTQEEIQILLVREEREKLFLQGITLAGTKCLLIRDNLYTEGNNTIDLHTKGQSRGSQAVKVVQIESVYLVVMGHKGTEGGSLNLKAFKMACYIREAIHQHLAHF
ncbi:profilin-2-like [Physeter macrocephalus]|uniref:Profilin n=1 Tax=Physeter macrocephalus TaxID=9755 RepID=A0A2Y9S3F7_PHYMC|nr:profilin-2-like [Physeter catodon]|eukprot:XP_023973073.1 profilin-2-like [Physeter catodon]